MSTFSTADHSLADKDITAWRRWKQARRTALTAPQGCVALECTDWLPVGAAEPQIDGETSDGKTQTVISRRDPEGTRYAIRTWDAQAPVHRNFLGVDTYEYDPAWVLSGTWHPSEPGATLGFRHRQEGDRQRAVEVPGTIALNIDGTEYSLTPIDNEGTPMLVFSDGTTGNETYGAGRFLKFRPNDFHEDGSVVVNFNYAFVPPCGFSDQFNCPLPPAGNRIQAAITAGERTPIFGA